MAHARIVGEPKVYIELKLTLSEAVILRTVLDSVGGPDRFSRGKMDELLGALERAGIHVDDCLEIEGSIMLEMSRRD